MAKNKDITSADILKIIQAGVSPGGVDSRRLLATLLANPKALEMLKTQATEKVSPYQRFDPSQTYDPQSDVNDVLFRYATTTPMYADLAKGYFEEYEAFGGTPQAETAANTWLEDKLADADEQTRLNIKQMLAADAPKYMQAEANRVKRQMSAFYKTRKAQGLEGTPGANDVGSYLEKQTGLAGLADIPTSIEELAKSKAKGFGESLAKKGRSKEKVSSLVAQFEKQFKETAKKKKLSAAEFTPKDVLAKLIGGL